ncbi:MAG: hypothetical protein ABEL76_01135, partial [Bradymonadaceae bacterium]
MSTTDLRNIAFVALCLTLGTSACRGGPKVASSSKAVQAGGMKFRLKGYEIRRPELSEDGRTHLYEKGVLALRLAIENTGS